MHIVVAAKPAADQPWVAEAVANLSKQTGATVAVVAADEVELERLAGVPRSVFTQQAEQSAAAMAGHLAERGIEATHTVLPGRALQAILEFADAQKADLIVVGSSSRPAVAERLLGSVPLDLIKKSSRPVLVITHPDQTTTS
jgi:nucleotide-binding universal stress UspA family protein